MMGDGDGDGDEDGDEDGLTRDTVKNGTIIGVESGNKMVQPVFFLEEILPQSAVGFIDFL